MILIMGGDFFSDIDSEEYLTNPDNMSICDFNTIANIEPAILLIYNLPVGKDIELKQINGKKVFINSNTGNIINV